MITQTGSGSAIRDDLAGISKHWRWLFVLGALLVLGGGAALGAAATATLASVLFVGSVWFVAGVLEVMSGLATRRWRGCGIALVTGILLAVTGAMMLARPDVGAGVLTVMLALTLIAGGTARVVIAITERFAGWGWYVASGIASVLLGTLVFARYPVSTFWLLGLVVAAELLFQGVTWIAMSLMFRGFRQAGPPGSRSR